MIDFESLVERRLHVQNDDESHVETDPRTFHPSQLARCRRQAVISKYGLEDHDTSTLGTFRVGTILHEWMEDGFAGSIDGVEFEKELATSWDRDIVITGRCDVYDSHENAVYDFKTRSSWYKFDPPVGRHLDQLAVYMDMLDADKGQVVYLSKKDLEVRTWPEETLWEDHRPRLVDLKSKAQTIADRIEEEGQPESKAEVPFEKCGCWVCENEEEPEGKDEE